MNTTAPTEIETVLAGAIGNLMNARQLIKHAQLIITDKGGIVEVVILPSGFRQHWHSPKYGTKDGVFRVSWGMQADPANDATVTDVIKLVDAIEAEIAERAKVVFDGGAK